MVKKDMRKKAAEKRTLLIILVFILFVFSVVALYGFNKMNESNLSTSQKNVLLMNEAKEKLDPSICNQINGGVEAEKLPKEKGLDVFANIYPDMNEAEAKARCRTDVQWKIDHSKK